MKSPLIVFLIIMAALVFTPPLVNAQTEQSASKSPPLSQPLVREGTLAVKLSDAMKVGQVTNEVEAESALTAAGIAPKNGWIADYPVTPDIAVELQSSVSDAAATGRISLTRDSAAKAFQDLMISYNLAVAPGISDPASSETAPPAYPESEVVNDYYLDEGPPVVTYYAPPPDYFYLYSWVPYPFWWWDFWFPGFFVLADFDIGFHGHHGRHHWHGGRDGEFISNHFRDPSTGRVSRIDPANRSSGGIFADREGTGWSSPSARSGAQSIFTRSRAFGSSSGESRSVLPSANGTPGPRYQNRTSVSPSARNSAVGAAVPSTYGRPAVNSRTQSMQSNYSARRTYAPASMQNRTFSRPAYRASGSYSTSPGGRSFSAPSTGLRSGVGSFGSVRGSFGGSRGSFGGGGSWRR